MPLIRNLAYYGAGGQPRLSIAGFIGILGFSQLSVRESSAEESQQILKQSPPSTAIPAAARAQHAEL